MSCRSSSNYHRQKVDIEKNEIKIPHARYNSLETPKPLDADACRQLTATTTVPLGVYLELISNKIMIGTSPSTNHEYFMTLCVIILTVMLIECRRHGIH